MCGEPADVGTVPLGDPEVASVHKRDVILAHRRLAQQPGVADIDGERRMDRKD
jgi:hypothetical protein